jgi:anti-sigma factor RsiW
MDLDAISPRERLETLSAYLDGELPDEAARAVTAWLERHPEALREIEHQRRLWSLLGRYGEQPVPEGFARRVLAAARLEVAPPPFPPGESAGVQLPAAAVPNARISRRRLWAFSAAAAVLAAVGTAILLGSRPEPRPGTQPGATQALAELDADFVQHADLAQLVTLSDDQFSVVLLEDPDALADGGVAGG